MESLLENVFGKSESRLLEYCLSEGLKVAGTYWTSVSKVQWILMYLSIESK